MNILLKVMNVVFPLITFPYVSRTLGSDAYGRIAFVGSVISYFSLVASLGIPSYGIRQCAKVRDDTNELSKTVKELLTLNFIFLAITYTVFIFCILAIPRFREDIDLLLIYSAGIILQTAGVEWFYQSIEQYDYITLRNFIFKIIFIILLFSLVHSPQDVRVYCIIIVGGSVGSNILNFLRLQKYVNLRIRYNLDLQKHIRPIFTLFFYYAATTIYTNLDSVMLGFLTTTKDVGFYNASVKVKNILVGIITALGSVALPRISYYLEHKDSENFNKLVKTSFSCVLFISIPFAIYFVMEAEPVLMFLAGEEYAPAISAMRIITPSIIFIGLGSVTAYQLLIPLGKDRMTLIGAVTGAVVDTVVNFILIPKYKAAGAAWGTLIAEIVVSSMQAIYLRKIVSKSIDVSNLMKILIAGTAAGVVVFGFNAVFQIKGYFLICAATAILYFGTYLLICIGLKEKFVMENGIDYLKKFTGKISASKK